MRRQRKPAHGPEPWRLVRYWKSEAGDFPGAVRDSAGGEVYAGPSSFHALKGEGNAKRIVAAVNACAGVPTEELEHVGAGQLAEVIRAAIKAMRHVEESQLARGVAPERRRHARRH